MASKQLVVRRRRASTLELKPPNPESTMSAYDEKRIRGGLDYAERRLNSTQRKPTPNTEKLLLVYSQACSRYLTTVTNLSLEERTASVDEIRAYEIDMSNRSWISDVPSSVSEKPDMYAVLELRKMSYLARYGDYTKLLANKLRSSSQKTPKTENWEKISGQFYWTEISQKLMQEAPAWKASGGIFPERVETTLAVQEACYRVGISLENMVKIINTYGQRNEVFHTELESLLETENYSGVARMLHDDLKDLSSVCPAGESDTEDAMRAVLQQLVGEWFETTRDVNNPGTWKWKPAITERHDQKKSTEDKADEWRKQVVEKAKNRLAVAEEEVDLLMQAGKPMSLQSLPEEGPGFPTKSGKGKKREASSTLIDCQNRKKTWGRIVSQQRQAEETYRTTLSQQREVNKIVAEYRAEHGEELPSSPIYPGDERAKSPSPDISVGGLFE